MEHIIARNLNVTCHDGSVHDNVTLKVCNGKRIYTNVTDQKLSVDKINSGLFLVPPDIATMIHCNYPMEVD